MASKKVTDAEGKVWVGVEEGEEPPKAEAQPALALAPRPGEIDYAALEPLLAKGDLSRLSEVERSQYILTLCKTLQLNPMTKPFDFLTLNGRLLLYINRNATDQLRKVHRVNLTIVERGVLEVGGQPTDVYTVKAHAALPDGRTDESVGAVSIRGKSGEDLANCVMRAETKAKRRVTLSILGLSFTDESELDTINYVKPQAGPEPRQITPRLEVVSSQAVISPGGVGTSPSVEATSADPAAAPSAGLPPPVPPAGRGPSPTVLTTPRVGGPLPPPRPATPAPKVSTSTPPPPPPQVVQVRPSLARPVPRRS